MGASPGVHQWPLWTWPEICTPYMSQVTPQAKAPKKARQISLHMLHTHTLLIHNIPASHLYLC